MRGEHRTGYERFTKAARQIEEAGYLCGDSVNGPVLSRAEGPFACRVEMRRGVGAYVCGEETALIESIEGKRGFPGLRPPYQAEAGLWSRPKVINNVETLAKVPPIIIHGARWYNALGTPESAGAKLFAVSGPVLRPGGYEAPFGVPLRPPDLRSGGRAAGGPHGAGGAHRRRGRHGLGGRECAHSGRLKDEREQRHDGEDRAVGAGGHFSAS